MNGGQTAAAAAASNGNGHGTSPSPPPIHRTTTGDLGNNQVVRATEGWLELFLTPAQKLNFCNWNEVVRDKSLVHSWTDPFFAWLVRYLPPTLAPNLITLAGFLALAQAWYLTNTYGADYPVACTWLVDANILLFFICNQLSTHHADAIRQHTSLADLFKYSCDMGSTVWIAVLTTYCLGGTNIETQWYAVQSCQLALFLKHLSAYKRNAGLRYRLGAGPGEVLVICMLLLALRAVIGLNGLVRLYHAIVVQEPLKQYLEQVSADDMVRYVYYGMFSSAIIQVLLLGTNKNSPNQGWTRFGLIASLLMRLVPALLLQAGLAAFHLTVMDVICDGLFLAVLTSDLTLAKMAGRGLHPWVVLMSLAAVLSHTTILACVVVYYIAVFADLCFYMNLPLLANCRNVYCDGVYDLCHIGHKRAFQNALTLGNRLLVGVVGDKDASQYKRPPIMSHAERCAEVEACKSVTKVIPNAPCFGLTQDFLDEHQIHVVAFGEEYLEKYPNPDDDPYYGYVRKLGIGCPLPRTNTLSTTDLIRRIQAAANADDKKSPT